MNQSYSGITYEYPMKLELTGKKPLKVKRKIPENVKVELSGKGWNLMRFYLFRKPPVVFTIPPNHSRYISARKVRKEVMKTIKRAKVEKVFQRTIKLY